MQNKKKHISHIAPPHFIILGIIILFLFLKEAPPKVSSLTETLSSNEAFSVTWNKSLKQINREEKIKITQNGKKVVGTFTSTPTTTIFSPETPWKEGESYTIKILPIPSAKGDVASKLLEKSISIKKEKILFINPQSQIVEGNPENGKTKIITPESIEISYFSTGFDGRFAAIYKSKDDDAVGILFAQEIDNEYKLTILPAQKEVLHTYLKLCNKTQQLLFNVFKENEVAVLKYFDLQWEKGDVEIRKDHRIQSAPVFSEEDATCSQDTARIVYTNKNGTYVTSFLGEKNENFIGIFNRTVGFSPRDSTLAFEKTLTEDNDTEIYSSELSLHASTGEESTFSKQNATFEKMSWNGNGKRFAVLHIANNDYTSQIKIYDQKENKWTKKSTIPSSTQKRFTNQALSTDGRTLAIEVTPEEDIYSEDHSIIQFWDLDKKEKSNITFNGTSPQWLK